MCCPTMRLTTVLSRCVIEWTALWPRTPRRLKDQWHDYLATITTIDQNVGRLMEHLRRTGQMDNTIIAFTSDHGLAMG